MPDGGYAGVQVTAEYIERSYRRHASAYTSLLGEIRGNVLEIGPGASLAVALKFLDEGAARMTCIDVIDLVSASDELYEQIAPDAARLRERLEYRCPEAIETTQLPSETFDFVYSAACMEHVVDPEATVRQIARLLKPGGVTSHQIDMRDHRDFDHPLHFLRYPERVWRISTSRRIYTNRWRTSDWLNAYEEAGLELHKAEPNLQVEVSEGDRRAMQPRFRTKDLEDLAITGVWLVARKPTESERRRGGRGQAAA